jgi:hypothetical protein
MFLLEADKGKAIEKWRRKAIGAKVRKERCQPAAGLTGFSAEIT